LSLWSTCAGVQEGLVAALCGPWRYSGAEEVLGVVRLACSDTLSVRLCWLGPAYPRRTFWSLLSGKGGQLEGLKHGPKSPRAPGGREGACLLLSRPVHDPIGGAAELRPRCSIGEPQASMAWGMSSCARALAGVVGWAGAKDRAQASRGSGA
jgi:hypothetical protein